MEEEIYCHKVKVETRHHDVAGQLRLYSAKREVFEAMT